jgi:hypothetical protein
VKRTKTNFDHLAENWANWHKQRKSDAPSLNVTMRIDVMKGIREREDDQEQVIAKYPVNVADAEWFESELNRLFWFGNGVLDDKRKMSIVARHCWSRGSQLDTADTKQSIAEITGSRWSEDFIARCAADFRGLITIRYSKSGING